MFALKVYRALQLQMIIQCRSQTATSIKNEFSVNVPLVVHWDGKLLKDLTGKQHVDRLPVFITGQGVDKLLGVPKLVAGTGTNTAAAVYAILETGKWPIK